MKERMGGCRSYPVPIVERYLRAGFSTFRSLLWEVKVKIGALPIPTTVSDENEK